jgi:hypothetical protein
MLPDEQVGGAPNIEIGDHAPSIPYEEIMTPDLTDDEKLVLAALLRRGIEDDRYPLSPRLRPSEAILAKLDPPAPCPKLPPPLRAYMAPSARRRRRRG